MPVDLKIKVTKEILGRSKMCGLQGFAGASTNCAIAIAIRDIFPQAVVGRQYIILDEAKLAASELPYIAQCFIAYFDNASPVRRLLMNEIEFTISIPDLAIEKINIEAIRPLLINHPTLELL